MAHPSRRLSLPGLLGGWEGSGDATLQTAAGRRHGGSENSQPGQTFGLPLLQDVPVTVQERAWGSPIRVTPSAKAT
ncbi:MAG: hypothetical protein ACK587_03275 [Cyanobacteriota bacterium]|jgi:hypothetical protein